MLYADLWSKETSWAHITAASSVITQFGCPLNYYVDNHSIFRFIQKRDILGQKKSIPESEALVQWKEPLLRLNIDITYAMSPQAKGKIERPYRWLQDHLTRSCMRESVTTIQAAREILYHEIYLYNQKRVHSTTGEIPNIRFEKALEDKKSMFRPFVLTPPLEILGDLFCYRALRVVDAYRKITFGSLKFSITQAPIGSTIELRLSFDLKKRTTLIRFWHQSSCVGQQTVKTSDIKGVHF